MSERTFYVVCKDDCMTEGMSKEQILAAIEQSLEQGYVSDPSSAVFSKIKEIRANSSTQIWVGTEAQFNAISPAPTISKSVVRMGTNGVLYLCTDDSTLEFEPATPTKNGLMLATDKAKLDGIETGATKTIIDAALNETSTNPVQNKVVTQGIKTAVNDAKEDRGYGIVRKEGSIVSKECLEGMGIAVTSTIEPVQSGSGDPSPSNVRPITGWTGATLTRCGKNLINPQIDTDNYYAPYASTNADGSITVSNSSSSKVYPVTVWTRLPSGTYTAKFMRISGSNQTQVFLQCNDTADYSSNIAALGVKTFTLSEETQVRFMVIAEPSASYTASIQIEQGSTATAYAPYQVDTYTADFGQTVYGGTLDWNTGVLTATHGQIAAYAGEGLPGAWISDRDAYAAGAMPTTGAQVVYELATPQTIQLTPQEVAALEGVNTVYTDAGPVIVDFNRDANHFASVVPIKMGGTESTTPEGARSALGAAAQSAFEYSTSEVTTAAKWLDGKTIYRKVFQFGSIAAGGSTNIDTGLGTSLDTVVSLRGMAKLTDSNYVVPLPYADSNTNYLYRVQIFEANTEPKIGVGAGASGGAGFTDGFVVLEYTKK